VPYSDHPPTCVYPDTAEGRQDHHNRCVEAQSRIPVAFCSEFKKDSSEYANHLPGTRGVWCANRCDLGDRAHNWCFKCPAGFLIWNPANDGLDPLSDETREKASVLSW